MIMSLSDLIEKAAASKDNDGPMAKIEPEAAIMRLREAAKRYAEMAQGPRFKVGDIVTPVEDCDMVGRGMPYLVIQTIDDARPEFKPEHQGSNRYGRSEDLRLLTVSNFGVVALWAESAVLEPWVAGMPVKGRSS